MTTCAEWATKLAEADAALHKLLLGGKVEVLRDGEKTLQYSAANLGELRRYVEYLQAKVDACNGATPNKKRIVRFIPEDGC